LSDGKTLSLEKTNSDFDSWIGFFAGTPFRYG